MKTQYEIRNPSTNGVFISFDTADEAIEYWQENCEQAPETHRMHGAVVVRHTWETHHEAETARLNWLLSEGSIAALNAECDKAPAIYENPETWLTAARTALDICRKAPPRTVTLVWPNGGDEARRCK